MEQIIVKICVFFGAAPVASIALMLSANVPARSKVWNAVA